ncbi:MAG: hypothetical protein R3C68_12110 [Myxococcota bacterium]
MSIQSLTKMNDFSAGPQEQSSQSLVGTTLPRPVDRLAVDIAERKPQGQVRLVSADTRAAALESPKTQSIFQPGADFDPKNPAHYYYAVKVRAKLNNIGPEADIDAPLGDAQTRGARGRVQVYLWGTPVGRNENEHRAWMSIPRSVPTDIVDWVFFAQDFGFGSQEPNFELWVIEEPESAQGGVKWQEPFRFGTI